MIKFVFYDGFLIHKAFFLLLGWGESIILNGHVFHYNKFIVMIGLPIPIVAVSVSVSHNEYGYNNK